MKITVMVENFATKPNIKAEYGLSLNISNGEKQILMDTGQSGEVLLNNSSILGVDLAKTTDIVLSHGHFDHAGGLNLALMMTGRTRLWAHKDFTIPHSRFKNNRLTFIGCHYNHASADFYQISSRTEISENIWGIEIPEKDRDPIWMTQPPHLVIPENNELVLDPFTDDISLVIKTEKGLSVLLGCAHAGVVNILEKVSSLFDTRDFYSVMGGMHLSDQSDDFIQNVTSELVKRFNVQKWRPCHCSGFKPAAILAQKAEDVLWAGAGTVINI